MSLKEIGSNLRRLREVACLSQSRVSTLIQKNRGTYRRLEKGEAVLDITSMVKLCWLYGVTPNDILKFKTFSIEVKTE